MLEMSDGMRDTPDPTEVVDVLLEIMSCERGSTLVVFDGIDGVSREDFARELLRRTKRSRCRKRTRT
jgi:predicted alpha/beta-fold hydrolase